LRFNRTSVESKQALCVRWEKTTNSFNRTSVESKPVSNEILKVLEK